MRHQDATVLDIHRSVLVVNKVSADIRSAFSSRNKATNQLTKAHRLEKIPAFLTLVPSLIVALEGTVVHTLELVPYT